MKNKKGFTLIELLAVIVILAIIALIATPIILNMINDAKKSAAVDSVYGYIEAIEYNNSMTGINKDKYPLITSGNITSINDKVNIKGTKPTSGSIRISNSKVTKAELCINNYSVIYDGKEATVDTNNLVCDGKSQEITLPTGLTKGASVYINPETATVCKESEAVSTTGTKTGCMKWHVYKDNGDGTYQLILDHNTTATISWVSKEDYIAAGGTETDYGTYGNNTKGPITVTKQLKSDTSKWNNDLNARLITADEIAEITVNTTWNKTSYFYFDTKTTSRDTTITTIKKSKYSWLFDNTSGCTGGSTEYGCNTADSSTIGYWTFTPYTKNVGFAWYVKMLGNINAHYVNDANDCGVRPVITF